MAQVDNYTATSPAISNNGFLLSVAVFPVLVAGLLTLVIKAFVPFSTIDADTQFASISSPKHNSSVSRQYVVSGTTKQSFGDKHLFLVEETSGIIYPKVSVPSEAGPWSANLYTGAPVGNNFRIVLLAINTADKTIFKEWLNNGEQTGEYPGLTNTESMQELTAVTVQVLDE